MSEKKNTTNKTKLTLKIGLTAILIAIGVVLSYLNPFGYFTISGTKINPFAHLINAISGVLLGLSFSVIAASSIAVIRYSTNIGSIHAFHGGIPGAIVVSIVSYFLYKKYPKYVEYATFFEPLGTVFVGGTITAIIEGLTIGNLFFYWSIFLASSAIGSALGFILLKIIKDSGYSRETFCN